MIDSQYQKVSLGDLVSTMHQGINTAADKVVYSDAGTPIIQSKHFTSGKLEIHDTKFLGATDVTKYGSKYIPTKGDVLFSNIGTVGKSVVVGDCPEFMFAWNVFLIRPKHDLIGNKYLQYYLGYLSYLGAYERYFTGGTVKFLNKKTISAFQIPLPPLPEQQKIAAILDAADQLRQKDQQLIEHYTRLGQALFLEMFGDPVGNPMGWEKQKFGEVLDLITYGLTVRPKYVENGIPLISAREIRNGFVEYLKAPKIEVSAFDKLSDKAKPKKYDILFSKTGSIGHCAIVDNQNDFAITQNAARLTFSPSINPIYAINYLKTPFIQQLSQRWAKGNAVKDLQLGDMKKFNFLIPPLELQNQFAQHIEAIEQQKQSAQASLEKSEALFNSLLQRAFKGELTG